MVDNVSQHLEGKGCAGDTREEWYRDTLVMSPAARSVTTCRGLYRCAPEAFATEYQNFALGTDVITVPRDRPIRPNYVTHLLLAYLSHPATH